MNITILIIIGISGGILGGMGMGGGTLLIPLLVSFASITQHGAQMINLVAFIPMALVALVIHAKNGLVKWKYLLIISLPAAVIAIGASMLASNIEAAALKRYFGIFLIVLAVYQLTTLLVKMLTQKTKCLKVPSLNKSL